MVLELQLNKLGADELLDALAAGVALGEAKYNSRVKFIADISREFPATQTEVLA